MSWSRGGPLQAGPVVVVDVHLRRHPLRQEAGPLGVAAGPVVVLAESTDELDDLVGGPLGVGVESGFDQVGHSRRDPPT